MATRGGSAGPRPKLPKKATWRVKILPRVELSKSATRGRSGQPKSKLQKTYMLTSPSGQVAKYSHQRALCLMPVQGQVALAFTRGPGLNCPKLPPQLKPNYEKQVHIIWNIICRFSYDLPLSNKDNRTENGTRESRDRSSSKYTYSCKL